MIELLNSIGNGYLEANLKSYEAITYEINDKVGALTKPSISISFGVDKSSYDSGSSLEMHITWIGRSHKAALRIKKSGDGSIFTLGMYTARLTEIFSTYREVNVSKFREFIAANGL